MIAKRTKKSTKQKTLKKLISFYILQIFFLQTNSQVNSDGSQVIIIELDSNIQQELDKFTNRKLIAFEKISIGNFKGAIEDLSYIILNFKKDKDYINDIYYNLGRVYFNNGDIDSAINYFRLSLFYTQKTKKFFFNETYLELSKAFQTKNKLDSSIKYSSIYIKEEVDSSIGYWNRAYYYVLKKDFVKAENDYKVSLLKSKKYHNQYTSAIYYDLLELYTYQNNQEKVLDILKNIDNEVRNFICKNSTQLNLKYKEYYPKICSLIETNTCK
ncbi:MAG: hypothetical protein JNL75_07890 [Chitinophagales bacterium]|nr:hypothetical protein [Chitinophagales bacterium]